jgi:hypothetical protein
MCNHKQPKYSKGSELKYIDIRTKLGYYTHFSSNNWRPGDEIHFNYSVTPSSQLLALNYGFVVKKNIYDNIVVKVKDHRKLTEDQKNLCNEIKCFNNYNKNEDNKFKERNEIISYTELNEGLLNYGRVRNLNEKFDIKEIKEKLLKDNFISLNNEVSAYVFYLNNLKENLKEEENIFDEIFREGSYIKNKIKYLESNSILELAESETGTYKKSYLKDIKNLKKLKTQETIYDFIFSIKNILLVHTNKILDKILEKNSLIIQNLKDRYLKVKRVN